MDINRLAQKARKSISSFCIEECKAYCCRKGYLVLTPKESLLVTQKMMAELESKNLLKLIRDSRYSLYLGDYSYPCPSLKDNMCKIHKKKGRPSACRDFPLFIEGETFKLSPRCLAVKTGMFYPVTARLLKLGYKLSKNNSYSDMEIQNLGFLNN